MFAVQVSGDLLQPHMVKREPACSFGAQSCSIALLQTRHMAAMTPFGPDTVMVSENWSYVAIRWQ
jgi:hypothetical protein